MPRSDDYDLWVRYEDYAGEPEPFSVKVTGAHGSVVANYGSHDLAPAPVPPLKWSYAWGRQTLKLSKGRQLYQTPLWSSPLSAVKVRISKVKHLLQPARRAIAACFRQEQALSGEGRWNNGERMIPSRCSQNLHITASVVRPYFMLRRKLMLDASSK